MGEYNIGNISGKNVVVGNGNTVNQSGISIESYLQDEAESFYAYNVLPNYCIADGHKTFGNELKSALGDLDNNEERLLFINLVKYHIQKLIEETKREKGGGDPEVIKDLDRMILLADKEISKIPVTAKTKTNSVPTKKHSVFISYSRKDKKYLDDLRRHFKPIEDIVEFWDDSKIKPGQKWKEEIEQAMSKAKVAIFLLSADFFNSDFIKAKEIPTLLEQAASDGTRILPVILKPCYYQVFPNIMDYQTVNDPQQPVSSMNENTREATWVSIVKTIHEELCTT